MKPFGIFIALAVALGASVVPDCARADDELQQGRVELGRIWYEKYCTPCHGLGGTPGSAVYPDTKQPVDLRNYVRRYGGNFPSSRWITTVFNPLPGGAHTKIWEKIRSTRAAGAEGDTEAHGVVVIIADYVISVQAK